MPTWKTSTSTRNRSTGTTKRSTSATHVNWSTQSPKFTAVKNECQWRIGSYKNVYSQFAGANRTTFSPAAANKFIRFINSGTRVYKFSNPDFCKHFGNQTGQLSPTTCTTILRRKFGQGIKVVTRGNNNCWLVAATGNVNTGPFRNYSWK